MPLQLLHPRMWVHAGMHVLAPPLVYDFPPDHNYTALPEMQKQLWTLPPCNTPQKIESKDKIKALHRVRDRSCNNDQRQDT